MVTTIEVDSNLNRNDIRMRVLYMYKFSTLNETSDIYFVASERRKNDYS